MKIAISGVTGLVGDALRASLVADGHEVIGLTRRESLPGITAVRWDVVNGRFDASPLEGVAAVVHLAGEPVAQRWTPARKEAIRESRLRSTSLLVEGLESLRDKPAVLVSASAVGYYGDGGDEELVETSPPGTGFLPDLCQEWEKTALAAQEIGIRTVCARTGIVLSTKGGALLKMLPPFKMGVGGPLGSGRQWMPWIHIDDMVGMLRFCIEETKATGPVNAASPSPTRNADFSRTLGRVLRRPAFFPAPAFALKLVFGQMSEVLLEGQRVLPARLQELGFRFQFPELEPALTDVIRKKK
jgi:uncharacterized protein (TIGR01777 family)